MHPVQIMGILSQRLQYFLGDFERYCQHILFETNHLLPFYTLILFHVKITSQNAGKIVAK